MEGHVKGKLTEQLSVCNLCVSVSDPSVTGDCDVTNNIRFSNSYLDSTVALQSSLLTKRYDMIILEYGEHSIPALKTHLRSKLCR